MPLTYKYVFSPNEVKSDLLDINFLCHDNKVHIRLRDYSKAEVLKGFEAKLTYLITYLFNYTFLPKFVGRSDVKALLKNFNSKSEEMKELNEALRPYMQEEFKGIKVSANYRKKSTFSPFGTLEPDFCPTLKDGKLITSTGLKFFLKSFNTTLQDFLFNDAYEVVLVVEKQKTLYNKFKNKQERKKTRGKAVEVSLW